MVDKADFDKHMDEFDEFNRSVHGNQRIPWHQSQIKKSVVVSFQREGFHLWPDAPQEVDFLQHEHRHVFHFRVTVSVVHNDRDIEFILLKRWLEDYYDMHEKFNSFHGPVYFGSMSCEMIAEDLIDYMTSITINPFIDEYKEEMSVPFKEREIKVEVYEDNENGGIVEYSPIINR